MAVDHTTLCKNFMVANKELIIDKSRILDDNKYIIRIIINK